MREITFIRNLVTLSLMSEFFVVVVVVVAGREVYFILISLLR